jgi:hypothetical protein
VSAALAALLLCVFSLASMASPNLAAARSFERIVRLAGHGTAVREARASAADRSFVAARPTVSVRTTLRDLEARDRCQPLGPMLPLGVAPGLGESVVASEIDFVGGAPLASTSLPALARARGPPVSA